MCGGQWGGCDVWRVMGEDVCVWRVMGEDV